jgi:hypothetical protein
VGLSRRQNVYPADIAQILPIAKTGKRRKYHIPNQPPKATHSTKKLVAITLRLAGPPTINNELIDAVPAGRNDRATVNPHNLVVGYTI